MRLEYAAGSAAIEKSTIVLDSSYDIHISHARDGDGSKVSPHRLTSLFTSRGYEWPPQLPLESHEFAMAPCGNGMSF